MTQRQVMISTVDNPHNPLTHFEEWLAFDIRSGYNSLGLLGRVANTAPDLTEDESLTEIERAIDEIVEENVLGVSTKVVSE